MKVDSVYRPCKIDSINTQKYKLSEHQSKDVLKFYDSKIKERPLIKTVNLEELVDWIY